MALSPQVTKDLSKRAVDVTYDAMNRVLSLASEDENAQVTIAIAAASGAIGVAAGHLMRASKSTSADEMLFCSFAILEYIAASLEKDGRGILAEVMKARPELARLFERAAAARS